MLELDLVDQRLLTLLQTAFPLCARPWEALGEQVGEDEARTLKRLRRLRQDGVLRQVSAIFDSRSLGYQSALVAAQAPAGRLESAAAVVSAHPGVSHNYEREHALNLWFTLATPPGRSLEQEAAELAARAALLRHRVLPSLRTFRIGVAFDLESGVARVQEPQSRRALRGPVALSSLDRAAIRLLQEDLPLVPRPFLVVARTLDLDEAELFDWVADAGDRGFLRRFAGVLRHREAGFGEGGMGVWQVPEERIEAVGKAFAQDPAVTHCYQRPSFEGWPYNLFTMVHGKTRQDCDALLQRLAVSVGGWTSRATLFSVREFKKERLKYFLEDLAPEGAGR
jgi:DNA-binding Lrp family transcriptional regulator